MAMELLTLQKTGILSMLCCISAAVLTFKKHTFKK